MIRAVFLLLLTLSFSSTVVFAAQNGNPAEPPLPEPLVKMRDEGAQMKYLGRDLGYDGWIAVQDGQEQYFYVTPDGSAFFLGVLFNKNGRAITFDQMQRLKGKKDPILDDLMNAPSQKTVDTTAPATPKTVQKTDPAQKGPSLSEQLFSDANNARWFVMGNKTAPVIYMFIDPRCPHCKEFLKDLKPFVDGGKLQIRAIPVGALTPESRPMAAFLLNAKDAPDRLFRLANGDDKAVPMDQPGSTKEVDANLDVMLKWKFSATPITVYRSKDGSVKLVQGRADNAKALLADLP